MVYHIYNPTADMREKYVNPTIEWAIIRYVIYSFDIE